jgi:DNA replication protein DnaC
MSAQTCQTHGRPYRRVAGKDVCTACLAAGGQEASASVAAMKRRSADLDLRNRILQAQIPERFASVAFEAFQPPTPRAGRISAALLRFAEDFDVQRKHRSGFVFTGLYGTGKTHLACAMAHVLLQQGYRPAYASLPAFTRAIRAAYGRPGAPEAVVQRLVEADFTILDEVDLHGSSDNDYTELYNLINARYEVAGRTTVLISNRPIERLVSDLDERIISRVLGGTEAISFDWESRRRVPAANRGAA